MIALIVLLHLKKMKTKKDQKIIKKRAKIMKKSKRKKNLN